MKDSSRVAINIDNEIAIVSLNRPEKHNALDMPMFYVIRSSIKQLSKNSSIRAIIVQGEGESFCSGLDLKSVMQSPTNGLKLLWKWWPFSPNLAQVVTVGWRKLKVPVIMVVKGKCWGGGMQIALGGDYRIADPNTSFSIMESKWGLVPDMGGTPALMENMPLDQAMNLAMTADVIDAEAALKLNLISKIEKDPMTAAMVLAEKLKERSPDTNKRIKKMYHQFWCSKQGTILASETFNQWRIIFSHNRKVAVKRALGDESAQYQ
ncbi:MAG: crotonase/enoyl-CoA hydratase family protein [Kangiellaceae bacterium]